MLTITREAAVLIARDRAAAGVPFSYGVRFFAILPRIREPRDVALAFVPEPRPGDAVGFQHGLLTFVGLDVSGLLDDAIVDARTALDGSGELTISGWHDG